MPAKVTRFQEPWELTRLTLELFDAEADSNWWLVHGLIKRRHTLALERWYDLKLPFCD